MCGRSVPPPLTWHSTHCLLQYFCPACVAFACDSRRRAGGAVSQATTEAHQYTGPATPHFVAWIAFNISICAGSCLFRNMADWADVADLLGELSDSDSDDHRTRNAKDYAAEKQSTSREPVASEAKEVCLLCGMQ